MFLNPTVSPKCIPGPTVNPKAPSLSEHVQKYAQKAHWGANSLIAYCCQNLVFIVDPISVQLITSLHGHRNTTTCVQWCAFANSTGIDRGNSSILATGDSNGNIIIWDAISANKISAIETGLKKPIVLMKWINDEPIYLLVVHENSNMSMWNVKMNQRIWRKDFPDPIMSISQNPFSKNEMCVATSTGWIYLISDLNTVKSPERVDKLFRVGGKEGRGQEKEITLLRDFVYSRIERQMYLVTKREIALYDMDIKQTIRGKSFHSGRADFAKLILLDDEQESMFTVHTDGSIAAWITNPTTKQLEAIFCDVVRGSKHGGDRPGLFHDVVFNSQYPNTAVAISTDGKVWVWKLLNNDDWILEGMLENTPSTITSIQASPFSNLLAVGTTSGALLVYNMLTGALEYKNDLFSAPARGIRWFGKHKLICFCSKSSGTNQYINKIFVVDTLSGKSVQLRKSHETDTTYIRGLRVSPLYQYLIVMPKDRPLEIWDLETTQLLRIVSFNNITALEWCPTSFTSKQKHGSSQTDVEHFFFTSADGSLNFYRVDRKGVTADSRKPKIFSYNQITALAWKGDFLVSGDAVGNISCWEISNKKSKSFSSHNSVVKKIMFSPESNFILVLFADGQFGIWDLDEGAKLSTSPKHIKAVSVDWAPGNYPVIATKSGLILIFDIGLATSNSSIVFHSRCEPVRSPAVLPKDHSHYLKAILQHEVLPPKPDTENHTDVARNAYGEIIPPKLNEQTLDSQIRTHFALIGDEIYAKLSDKNTTIPERCLLTAKFFGDIEAIKFWTLALKYLNIYKDKLKLSSTETKKQEKTGETKEISVKEQTVEEVKKDEKVQEETPEDKDTKEEKEDSKEPQTTEKVDTPKQQETQLPPSPIQKTKVEEQSHDGDLPKFFHLFRPDEDVRQDAVARVRSHHNSILLNKSRDSPDLYADIAKNQAVLGKKKEAVDLLLMTPRDHKDVHLNCLHACVIAASHSPQHFNHTVQVVAKGLMSFRTEKEVDAGVELLCLIGEGFKACRFLQDIDQWSKAARLAKCILPEDKSKIIMARWADHLSQNSDTVLAAVKIYLSLGLFKEVIELLHKSKMDDIASLFIKACEEFNVPFLSKETIITTIPILTDKNDTESENKESEDEQCKKLIQNIFTNYAVHLAKIGFASLSKEYAEMLATKYGHTVKIEEMAQSPISRSDSWTIIK